MPRVEDRWERWTGRFTSLGLTLLFLGVLLMIVLAGLYLWADMMSWGGGGFGD